MQRQIREIDYTGQNIYVGIDVHKSSWQVSLYTDELYHKTFNQPPKPEVLYSYLTKHFPNGTYYSVYEAGYCGYWIHDQLQSLGMHNLIVNPADIPTTDKEKKQKTDEVDSNKLAKQLRNGDLDAIYAHKRATLEDRGLLRLRRTLVKELTRYKNRIKAELYFFGIEIPEQYGKSYSHWSKRFINWLNEIEFTKSTGTDSFRVLIDQVLILRTHLLEVNKKVQYESSHELNTIRKMKHY